MKSRHCARRLMSACLAAAGLHAGAAPALDLEAEWRAQHEALAAQLADRSWSGRVAGQTLHPASLIAPEDRDPADVVLRRTAALLEHVRRMPGAPDLGGPAADLDRLRAEAAAVGVSDPEARYALYARACRLRRRIAFANPLLNFDRILFLTKDRPHLGDHHMVDQYYGFNAKPGGSLYVLENPWSDAPRARDLMAGAVVERGRLRGRRLQGGAFNTLDLDYDGKTVLFAYTECGPMPASPDWSTQPPDWNPEIAKKMDRTNYYWSPERTFHVFRAGLDPAGAGVAGLAQLTDGPFNEFDPCFLPGGRIAFISERRGGYLRCGGNRPNPNYTLHSMERDGRDIVTLSFHETQEWNPSVDNDGRIAYTRWDYVDRDNDGAHHLWRCRPDGGDPRADHGNYPVKRELRPWMEVGIRAVPGSRRYVAVASPHHGYVYGSLVLIDPGVEDDGAMSQVRRMTPEVHFPEAESAPGVPHERGVHKPHGEVYGAPWPLDETFSLCVYDPAQRNYGIHLVDAFGNKEPVWRDPEIACLDPIPLRARPRPPVIPVRTAQHAAERAPGRDETATVAVLNVYQSDFPWPEGMKIAALRVVELHPKTTWHATRPVTGIGAESLTRSVLGEVPVEADGSAHFEAPPGVPLYFQALDADGLAVQSMRTDTYLHPGERLTCVGCHESKQSTPAAPAATPLALQRPPSKLVPPREDARPVSFARLVQPVLDRNCTGCHQEKAADGAPPFGNRIANAHGWTEAYVSLAGRAWAQDGGNGIIVQNGMRSIPGKVGARASPLWALIEKGHYDVKLTPEDRKRLVLWLDLNSNFYGAYEELEAQAKGERVEPLPGNPPGIRAGEWGR